MLRAEVFNPVLVLNPPMVPEALDERYSLNKDMIDLS